MKTDMWERAGINRHKGEEAQSEFPSWEGIGVGNKFLSARVPKSINRHKGAEAQRHKDGAPLIKGDRELF
jgi:hypothetical protein